MKKILTVDIENIALGTPFYGVNQLGEVFLHVRISKHSEFEKYILLIDKIEFLQKLTQ